MKELWFLVFTSSLSTAGSVLSTIAITTLVFKQDTSGTSSALLQASTLLGIALMGFFGGGLLLKLKSVSLGIIGPLVSVCTLIPILVMDNISLLYLYVITFFLSFVVGIDHPNNLRVLNWNLDKKQKPAFFSNFQVFSQALSIIFPLLGPYLIFSYGIKFCIIVDILTYLISMLPWLFVSKMNLILVKTEENKNISPWIGFQTLFNDKNLRLLTISRIINNVAFVGHNISLPLFIANVVAGDEMFFAKIQGLATASINIGFIFIGFTVGKVLKNNAKIIPLVSILTSFLIFIAILVAFFINNLSAIILSSGILGIATYCFRISGISLGTALTPEDVLAEVIIAGDTLVRSFSFVIGIVIPLVFFLKIGIVPVFILLTSVTLLSPKILKQVYKSYLKEIENEAV